MLSSYYKYVLYSILFFGIASCSSQKFAVGKDSLDPFTIYSYPNLALPPIYYLSSQEIADKRRFSSQKQKDTQKFILLSMYGDSVNKNLTTKLSSEDTAFLQKANANQDFSDIRETLNIETLNIIKKDSSFKNKIFSNYQGEKLSDALSEYIKYNQK